jgi:hypothetical protein
MAHVAQLMRNHVVDRIDRGPDQNTVEDQARKPFPKPERSIAAPVTEWGRRRFGVAEVPAAAAPMIFTTLRMIEIAARSHRCPSIQARSESNLSGTRTSGLPWPGAGPSAAKGYPLSSQAVRRANPMDQRIESFLGDILALAGEEPDAVREGVRVVLAKCEAIFGSASV